jgi:histidinol-phosphate aminotransferase
LIAFTQEKHMTSYLSARLDGITPYVPGEQPASGVRVKLNTNENPYPPSVPTLRSLAPVPRPLELYPDPGCGTLCTAIAETYALTPEQVFVGNGSDEVLAFAFMAFCDTIAAPDITYSFYPVWARIYGIDYTTVPLNIDFTVPVTKFIGINKSIVLANPNAPTGIVMPLSEIDVIVRTNPDKAVIIDEAYMDFDSGNNSAIPLIAKYPNLLIVRTFSKSYSLAGLRVGYALGQPQLINGLETVKNCVNSYTLDTLAQAGAETAIRDTEYFKNTAAKIIATRERTAQKLRELGFKVCPSAANFLFISHPEGVANGTEPPPLHASVLQAKLREAGILTRHFNLPRIDNHLRVTIGTDEDMDKFTTRLEEIL